MDTRKTQPFILALGGDAAQPAQCFVVVEKQPIECDSLLSAVDLCYKTHQVLDLKYATQANAIWQFMDSVVFEVPVPMRQGLSKLSAHTIISRRPNSVVLILLCPSDQQGKKKNIGPII
jgi:hypothetical protein